MHNPEGQGSSHFAGGAAKTPTLISIAEACLADLDQVVESYLVALERLYAEHRVLAKTDRASLRTFGAQSFELILRRLAGLEVGSELENVSIRVGAQRAREGVEMEVLLAATRMDFQVLWSAMMQRASESDLPDLLAGVTEVWREIESHTFRTHEGYRDEQARAIQEEGDHRRGWFSRLMQDGGQNDHIVEGAASALDLEADGRFGVCFSPGASRRQLASVGDKLGLRKVPHYWQDWGRGTVLIVQLPVRLSSVPLDWLHSVPAVVTPVARGLRNVPDELRLAEYTLRHCADLCDEPRQLDEMWMPLIGANPDDVVLGMMRRVNRPLSQLKESERSRLIETALRYLTTSGSPAETAQLMFCHRNTVVNRINRLKEVTGFDLSRPLDASVILIAMLGPIENRSLFMEMLDQNRSMDAPIPRV